MGGGGVLQAGNARRPSELSACVVWCVLLIDLALCRFGSAVSVQCSQRVESSG